MRTALRLRRLAHVVRVVARHGFGAVAARRGWARSASARLDGPERLRVMLEELGGSFVKLGQMLALQPDILPLAYCNALFKLLDQVEAYPWEEARRVFREEHRLEIEDAFEAIDPRPLATASVGQVYVARLEGAKVAVKIQRPTVPAEFGADVRLMVGLMALIRSLRLRPFYWLLEPLGEFVAWTREELDYRFEARYSERLRRNAEHNAIQAVPRVYERWTTSRVHVAEFMEGVTLLQFLRAVEAGDEELEPRLAARGFDRRRFAAHVIDNFLNDAFRHGVYHADLHPANLMILPGDVVGYVDFGITGVMSLFARRHLVEMTLALAAGDMSSLLRNYLKVTSHGPKADPAGLRRDLDLYARAWYVEERGKRRLATNFTRIMSDMLYLSRRNQILPERDIVKYIRSSIAIDGLITRFAPGFDVGGYLVQSCSRFLRVKARSERLTVSGLLDWSSAGGRLAQTGPTRASWALDRLAARITEPASGEAREGDAAGGTARPLALAGAALAVALVAVVARPTAPVWGFNLWTAEVAFVLAAVTALVGGSGSPRAVERLERSSR